MGVNTKIWTSALGTRVRMTTAVPMRVCGWFTSRSPFARAVLESFLSRSSRAFVLRLPDGTCAMVDAGVVLDVWLVGEVPPVFSHPRDADGFELDQGRF